MTDLKLQTVYGSLMHHRAELSALGDAVHAKPYVAPPVAPVLYIKPANTFAAYGARIALPAPTVCMRACLGLIFRQNMPSAGELINKFATNNIAFDTQIKVALFADLTLPHSSFFRPPVKYNCFDGSLGLAQAASAWTGWENLQNLEIETWVNGQRVHLYSTADYLCSAAEQLHAVNQFVSFEAGDVLMLGCPPDAPSVQAGDVVEVRAANRPGTRQSLEYAA
jgi:5-oxopent-3-ene-1,2,5-tricarboxylate decarboxylase / 2-hydroxyhepta-2,4-diene-1,7-dioate isomerase